MSDELTAEMCRTIDRAAALLVTLELRISALEAALRDVLQMGECAGDIDLAALKALLEGKADAERGRTWATITKTKFGG